MHYYKRNLGDYAKKAGRLTMLQHGAYTLLIDSCYDREVFPTLEQAIEWTWASTEAEVEAVKFVLSRFFTLSDNGQYIQDRILQELLEYQAKSDKNRQIAIERETKRKEKSTNREQVVNESSPNHKPITTNHKPLTIKKQITTPEGVDESLWKDYLAIRNAAKKPLTETALKGLQREAAKAGKTLSEALTICCEKSWIGFNSDWLKDRNQSKTAGDRNREVMLGLTRGLIGGENNVKLFGK